MRNLRLPFSLPKGPLFVTLLVTAVCITLHVFPKWSQSLLLPYTEEPGMVTPQRLILRGGLPSPGKDLWGYAYDDMWVYSLDEEYGNQMEHSLRDAGAALGLIRETNPAKYEEAKAKNQMVSVMGASLIATLVFWGVLLVPPILRARRRRTH